MPVLMSKNVDVEGLLKKEQELQSQIDQMLGMQQPVQRQEEEKEDGEKKKAGIWDKFVNFMEKKFQNKDEEEENRPRI